MKQVMCVCQESQDLGLLKVGKIYDVLKENVNHYSVLDEGRHISCFLKHRFEVVEEKPPISLDSHYNFIYNLSEKDKENGFIKIDPYFVNREWKLSEKDDTGVVFHSLKLLSRFGEKNTKEREIKALYLQVKRLAELEGVSLE